MRGTFRITSLVLFAGIVNLGYGQPRLQVVEGTKLDLGSVNRGTVVEKKVSLMNTGSDTLILGKVEASCGCTGTLVSRDRIAPGESGTILITFNSRNFNGPVHKTIAVNSNSVDAPRTTIEFTATVIEEVSLSQSQFWFREAEVGRTSFATITVTNNSKQKLGLSIAKVELAGFSLRLPEKPIEPGASAELVAEFTPKTATRILSSVVSLKTTSTAQPELFIQVFGSVKEFKFE
jgi:hypothetical protein